MGDRGECGEGEGGSQSRWTSRGAAKWEFCGDALIDCIKIQKGVQMVIAMEVGVALIPLVPRDVPQLLNQCGYPSLAGMAGPYGQEMLSLDFLPFVGENSE